MLHLAHLAALATSHGALVYPVLFAVVFIETGVVVLPFLPSDSLLFIAGALASHGTFRWPLLLLLLSAAIAGDGANYALGSFMRRRLADGHRLRFIKQE